MFGRHRLDTKTPEQIRLMRRAGLVVGETLALMQERTAAGMTTAELDAIAEEHIRGQGATPSFLGYHGFTGSLCVSVNDEVVHGIPGSAPAGRGRPRLHRLRGDRAGLARRRRGLLRRRRPATRAPRTTWRWSTRPRTPCGPGSPRCGSGHRCSTWAPPSRTPIVAAGEARGVDYGIVEDYVGHGIGTEMHQDPQVPNYRVRDRGPDGPVRAHRGDRADGDPGQRRDPASSPTTGPSSPQDSGRAAHWENSVAVTEDGLWVLTALDGGRERLEALGAPYAPLS